MAYSKTSWVDDVTPISATNMNHIETGVYNLNNALWCGKCAGLAEADRVNISMAQYITFNREIADDYDTNEALSTNWTKLTVPTGATKIRIETDGFVTRASFGVYSCYIRKNGGNLQLLNWVQAHNDTYDMYWNHGIYQFTVTAGDYFQLYGTTDSESEITMFNFIMTVLA